MAATRQSRSATYPSRNEPPQPAPQDEEIGQSVVTVVRIRKAFAQRGEVKALGVKENRKTVQITAPNARDGKLGIERAYSFDAAFEESTTQQEFFDNCGIKDLLRAALDGYSVTAFAYGQTGSGKTYTMSGLEEVAGYTPRMAKGDETAGLIPRSIRYLFKHINNRPSVRYTVRAAYIEIANEQVFDLLQMNGETLPVRWDVYQGFFVDNLLNVPCRGQEDVLRVFHEGARNRKIGSHAMNTDSSRSHSMMFLWLDAEFEDPETGATCYTHGKVSFVDLAGSERLHKTKSTGAAIRDTGYINKSLFTLGKVITALFRKDRVRQRTGGMQDGGFVPYRDSKLTKLLSDSLGGAGMALMIACCSPAADHLDETLNTLQYASRAAHIKNTPQMWSETGGAGGRQDEVLRQENERLKAEVAQLRKRLAATSRTLEEVQRSTTGSLPRTALEDALSVAVEVGAGGRTAGAGGRNSLPQLPETASTTTASSAGGSRAGSGGSMSFNKVKLVSGIPVAGAHVPPQGNTHLPSLQQRPNGRVLPPQSAESQPLSYAAGAPFQRPPGDPSGPRGIGGAPATAMASGPRGQGAGPPAASPLVRNSYSAAVYTSMASIVPHEPAVPAPGPPPRQPQGQQQQQAGGERPLQGSSRPVRAPPSSDPGRQPQASGSGAGAGPSGAPVGAGTGLVGSGLIGASRAAGAAGGGAAQPVLWDRTEVVKHLQKACRILNDYISENSRLLKETEALMGLTTKR
eukprot:tig00020684_g12861.t1